MTLDKMFGLAEAYARKRDNHRRLSESLKEKNRAEVQVAEDRLVSAIYEFLDGYTKQESVVVPKKKEAPKPKPAKKTAPIQVGKPVDDNTDESTNLFGG
ncbi:MAG: hypothetical protein KAI70_00590 [Candidatus Omnitrophica bacterium]|nr:hypothetical protein [Candidatus Omnitrophota bacterium]